MKTMNKKTYLSPATLAISIAAPKLLEGSITDHGDTATVSTDLSGDYGGVFGAHADDADWEDYE